MTAQDIITASLKRIAIVGAGQTPSAEDSADALERLNALLDSWATERLFIPCIVRTTWALVSGTAAYTVGTGGAVNIARPVYVQNINFQDTSLSPTTEMPLEPLTDQGYANITQKAATATYPTCAYYNPTMTGAGLASITLWPVPTSSTLEGVIYAPTTLTQIAALSTTVILQPGYRWMLTENLAVMIAPEFGVAVPQELRESARDAKGNIKRANTRLVELATWEGAMLSGGVPYSIHSDT